VPPRILSSNVTMKWCLEPCTMDPSFRSVGDLACTAGLLSLDSALAEGLVVLDVIGEYRVPRTALIVSTLFCQTYKISRSHLRALICALRHHVRLQRRHVWSRLWNDPYPHNPGGCHENQAAPLFECLHEPIRTSNPIFALSFVMGAVHTNPNPTEPSLA
jgi:hypothetical protein